MISQNIFLFLMSLGLLWIGSGIAVNAILRISRTLHIKSFFISFFLLGFFTSMTEIMVGINSLLLGQPQVFVGNLIGSSVVVFLLIIPLLAVVGNGVNLNHTLSFRNLVAAVLVVGMPAILTLDNSISFVDAVVCITLYGYFAYVQHRQHGSLEKFVNIQRNWRGSIREIGKIILAMLIIFIGSNLLVRETAIIGGSIGISPFLLSLLILSVGTNVPELSIAVRSVLAKKKDIAFGNYVGSATLNTLEMGMLTLINRNSIRAEGSNYSIIAFAIGLIFFIVFGKSRRTISRGEGLWLLGAYGLFLLFELTTGPGWLFP